MAEDTWISRTRQRLDALKMTQSDLARQIGVSPSRLGNYLNGRREPSLEDFKKIVSELNVTSDWILFGGTNQPSAIPREPWLAEQIRGLPASARRDIEGFLRVVAPNTALKRTRRKRRAA